MDTLQIHAGTKTSTVLNKSENETDINQENYFNDSVASDSISQLPLPIKASIPSEDIEVLKTKLAEMDKENKKVKERLVQAKTEVASLLTLHDDMKEKNQTELEERKKEIDIMRLEQEEKEQKWLQIEKQIKQKYEEEIQSHSQNMSVIIEEVTTLNEKQNSLEERMQTLKRNEETIRNCEYFGFHSQIMHDFILPKFDLLINYIKESVPNIDEYFIDKIPKLTFVEINDATYAITLRGFPDHHTAFVAARDRIFNLSNSVNSAKEFYQRDINRIIRSITRTLTTVQADTNIWKQYSKILTQVLEEKGIEYVNRFNVYIKGKAKTLIERSILGTSTPPWIELRRDTDDFRNEYPLVNEIEGLKHQALDEFIKQNISFQKLKFDQTPTTKSIITIKEFVNQIQLKFKTDKIYEGYQMHHFSLIPNLLQQIMIYYSCFVVQLPLFESSRELLSKIDKNIVTTITTSTGSGKM
ncbi:unnamed protein product [Rotaria sp. Silwood1]|nr:unnamed protein product [Rotaria sp. Silwood1]